MRVWGSRVGAPDSGTESRKKFRRPGADLRKLGSWRPRDSKTPQLRNIPEIIGSALSSEAYVGLRVLKKKRISALRLSARFRDTPKSDWD